MAIRSDIVDAAAELFSAMGYDKANLEHVAERVGMKKGSLYYHIQSKQDLLLAIHERLIARLIGDTERAISLAGTPAEELRAVIHVAFTIIAEKQAEITVFLHERRALEGARWREVVSERNRYQEMVKAVIERGQASGEFAGWPADILTLGVLGMTNWGYQWFRQGAGKSAAEIADTFADLVLFGLAVDD